MLTLPRVSKKPPPTRRFRSLLVMGDARREAARTLLWVSSVVLRQARPADEKKRPDEIAVTTIWGVQVPALWLRALSDSEIVCTSTAVTTVQQQAYTAATMTAYGL